jgi:uncharacterized membrane protein
VKVKALEHWDDTQVETIIGLLLRAGVLIAAAVVFVGAVLFLVRHGGSRESYRTFAGAPDWLRSPDQIVANAMHLSGRAVIQLGLLLLIATPVARVAFSAIAFLLERDYLYVLITLIVFGTLLFSLFGGVG